MGYTKSVAAAAVAATAVVALGVTANAAPARSPHVVSIDLAGPNTHIARAFLTSGRIVRVFGPQRPTAALAEAMREAQTSGGAVTLMQRPLRSVYVGGRNLELVTMRPIMFHASMP